MEKNRVEQLVEKAKSLRLEGAECLVGMDMDEVCGAYNGIGPQFLGEKLRDGMTEILHVYEPAALIHDIRFDRSDGTRRSFDRANREFCANCRKCANDAYAWWSWRRYRAYAVIRAMNGFVCADGGWKAWNDAHDARRGE